MIDPDITNSSLTYTPTEVRLCRECGKENAVAWMPLCQSCAVAEAQRYADESWTDKVVLRAERDPVYAARLKMALGL